MTTDEPAREHLRDEAHRVWRRVSRAISGQPAPQPEPLETQAPPEAVLIVLRDLGVAMCRAGDAADRVTAILDDVAGIYGADGVHFFVLPTGVFVRIATGESTRVDFATGSTAPLRLDQVDELYRIVDDIRHRHLDPVTAAERIAELDRAGPRFSRATVVAGTAVVTLGLGLMMNPAAAAIPAYVVIGLVVGLLHWWGDRDALLAPVLPVLTAGVVTFLAFRFAGPWLGVAPLDIVIPSLVTFLPGAALTIATVELSSASMISGASRLVYGLERLLLLTFGIAVGVQLAGLSYLPADVTEPLGQWVPWVGVLVFAVGQYVVMSAPRRTLAWLVVVLYVAYLAQSGAGLLLGSLGGSFVAGAVVFPVAYWVQARPSGPPAMVTFLPAFWLLVPGALGLRGVAEMVGPDQVAGLGDFINALLSIVAIAVGVLVGAGWAERVGRTTRAWRGL